MGETHQPMNRSEEGEPLALDGKPGDDTNTILEQRGVSRIVDISLQRRGIGTNLRPPSIAVSDITAKTSKLGIDAIKPLENPAIFERADVPEDVKNRIDLIVGRYLCHGGSHNDTRC